MLIVGTETSGSIISPSQANGLVGLRPTVGLVPGYGIAPISASQDTAGPMDRTVANAAMTLQSIAGYDAHNADYYRGIWGAGVPDAEIIPPVPATVPNYMSALDPNFVRGKRIGWNGTHEGPDQEAKDALVAAGAILVERPNINPGRMPGGVLGLRGQARHRLLLPAPRPGRADQDRRAGDGRQPGQRARGAEVRQRHARERVRDRHQPALGGLGRLPQRRAASASSSRTPGSTG